MKLMKMIFILLLLISITTCSRKLEGEQSLRKPNQLDKNVRKAEIEHIIGKWTVYQTKKGNAKNMCGSVPCGVSDAFEIFLDEGKLSCKTFTGVDSTVSPPKTGWREGEIVFNKEEFSMVYPTDFECTEKYTVQEVSENKLFGTFVSKNCKLNGKIFNKEGDFSAIKFTNENK
jgi:hypothetical protein